VLHGQKERGDATNGRSDEVRDAEVEAADQRLEVSRVDNR
jgi:hypothetical protein